MSNHFTNSLRRLHINRTPSCQSWTFYTPPCILMYDEYILAHTGTRLQAHTCASAVLSTHRSMRRRVKLSRCQFVISASTALSRSRSAHTKSLTMLSIIRKFIHYMRTRARVRICTRSISSSSSTKLVVFSSGLAALSDLRNKPSERRTRHRLRCVSIARLMGSNPQRTHTHTHNTKTREEYTAR